MVLGILEHAPFTEARITLSLGDMLLLYTDGIPEARSASGEFYGDEKMQSIISDNQGQPAAEVLFTLTQSVQAFSGETDPFEDITAVFIRRSSLE